MNLMLNLMLCTLPLYQGEDARPGGLIPLEALSMQVYVPQNSTAQSLAKTAEAYVGKSLAILYDDGVARSVHNLRSFKDTILIYDEAKRIEKVVAMLRELDGIAGEADARHFLKSNAEQKRETEARNAMARTVLRYVPRSLSAGELTEAIVPLQRNAIDPLQITELNGSLLLSGSEHSTEGVLRTLRQIDVPSPQILVSCFLVRGSETAPAKPAPAELAAGLTELMGYRHVETLAQGLLRTSSNASELALVLETAPELALTSAKSRYELHLSPAGYDPAAEELTLAECQMVRHGKAGPDQMFRTKTALTSGEYTVLGASGTAPLFVVLRFTPVQTPKGGSSKAEAK